MRAALVVALLAFSVLLAPPAAAASWSVDGLLVVESAEKASLLITISGLTNTRLTYSVPDGATFVEARDSSQDPVTVTPTGDDVEIQIRTKPVTLRFDLAPEAEAPLTHYRIAPLGAGSDSPTTMRLQLGAGWTYLSAADRTAPSPTTATASGTFSRVGGGYFDYILARPGLVVPPADATLAGSIVKRVANATVSTGGTHVVLTQTYDTDVYSRDWQMPIPENATGFVASSPLGAIVPVVAGGSVTVRAPYPTGYHLGARPFTIEYDLAAPDAHGGAFQRANISIRAQDGDDVWLDVDFAEGLTPTGAISAGAAEEDSWLFHARGPIYVSAGFLPPIPSGRVRFTEGSFLVDAPASMATAALATARNATQLLPTAASFAVTGPVTRPFAVAFTDADVFGWEAGFYSNGLNTISIRAKVLENSSDGQPHLEAVGVLVHEATHGLIDRLMPDAPRGVSFLHEGLSRLAETRAESAFPDEVLDCNASRTRCQRESARPNPEETRDYLRSGVSFDEAWTTSTASDAERGFLYDYSGLIMHQYALRAPQGALDAALLNLSRQTFEEDAPDTGARVVATLLAHAPGTTRDALLYPGKAAAQLSLDEFRYCMYGLVAPAYPWEGDGARPAAGCPPSGYGPSDAPLPELPPERDTSVEPVPTPPTPTPPPPEPATRAPTTAQPTPTTSGEEETGGAGERPAAVAEPPAATPGLGALAATLALVAVAALTRRS